jgi:6,7-dimethyl-8-ribityllumazine synthase
MSDYDEHSPVEAGETAITSPPPVEAPTAIAPSPLPPAHPAAPVADGSAPPVADGPAVPVVDGPAVPVADDPAPAREALGADPISEETAISEESVLAEDPALAPSAEAEEALEEEAAAAEEGDPFAWPQTESAEVAEEAPEQSPSVEHAAGEIDVPTGYTMLEGRPSGHRRSVAVVVSRYNAGITNRMLARAIDALEDAGVNSDAVTIMPVPGAFELPLAAMALAKTRRYACVVALGAIVRGETPHFDYIASEAASGLQLAAIETGVPVAFGVLTVESVEQAEERVDRAVDAVQTALEMADVFAQLRASART